MLRKAENEKSDDRATQEENGKGYSSYSYETDRLFRSLLQGDRSKEEEFFRMFDRDIKRRLDAEDLATTD